MFKLLLIKDFLAYECVGGGDRVATGGDRGGDKMVSGGDRWRQMTIGLSKN